MTNKQNAYNNTSAGNNQYGPKVVGLTEPTIRTCRITGVLDNAQYERLEVCFDLAAGEDAGLFAKCTKERNADTSKKPTDWWYQGKMSISYKDIKKDDGTTALPYIFKNFTTSVEESNENYRWVWNEMSLLGKTVVVVFGEVEEEIGGKACVLIKPRMFRSVKALKEAVKNNTVDKMLVKRYVVPKKAYNNGSTPQYGNTPSVPQYDDCPF